MEELLEPGDSLNPFKLFKLARHLYFDWKKWFRFLKEQIGSKEILKAQRLRPRMPSVTDYKEALYAIYRLQTTYDLDPAEMSEGLLRGKQYRLDLTNLDIEILAINISTDARNGALWNV